MTDIKPGDLIEIVEDDLTMYGLMKPAANERRHYVDSKAGMRAIAITSPVPGLTYEDKHLLKVYLMLFGSTEVVTLNTSQGANRFEKWIKVIK